jgi:recombination endonuclease VII
MTKIKTAADKDREKDKRIQRKFGITLADRDDRIRQQNNKCKICSGPLDAYGPPNIDHFHFYISTARVSVGDLAPLGLKWVSRSYNERGQIILTRYAKTREASRAVAKMDTMAWSIRGLLCFKCNRGLGAIEKFFNAARHPENLLPVIEYFRARLAKPIDN